VANADLERIQRLAARLVATSPAGLNLFLIGGFRYRLLDQSARLSLDIDYHWEGDLDEKQQELQRLCRRALLARVRRELGYEGRVDLPKGPDVESANVRLVELRFWKASAVGSQIEVPLEITRIICLDPTTVRTAEGVVYPTPSDTDLIEGKILAVFNRIFLQHRDLVDLFLYGDRLAKNSPGRLKDKLKRLQVDTRSVQRRLRDLEQNAGYHARVVQGILDTQVDLVVAAQIKTGGGGRAVFARALQLIQANVQL